MFKWRRVHADKELAPGQMFGTGYKLIEKIGAGGMGVVWTASQVALKRTVAIKVIKPDVISETGVARFKNEAELAAGLRHHCIVAVHDFGELSGQYYLCMDFIEGPTLEARIAKGVLPPPDAAIVVRAIADAIRYAHERNVIHRDLKPSNILLDAEDSGSPRVTDFGLARKIDVSRGLTVPGSPLGTANYMSPEQALGQTALIKKPTDLFALGAILHYTLTGCPPFLNLADRDECLDGPRSIKRDVPEDLDSICRACLAINPDHRLNARDLTARLDAFLETVSKPRPMRLATVVPNDEHVVICGLGDLGLRLALEGRKRSKSIVAIEQNGDSTRLRQARNCDIEVIDGDATEPSVLKQARVDEADFVIAACLEDETNVAIAAHIREVLPPTLKRRSPLVCRLLLTDYDLRPLVANESYFPTGSGAEDESLRSNYHINFGDLDLYDTAARQCLRDHNLDFEPIGSQDKTLVHLVVAGFGPMGQSVALQAARIAHFANGVGGDFRPCITVVDEADEHFQGFRRRYPKIDEICQLRFEQADRQSSLVEQLGRSSADAAEHHRLVTYAVCFEKEQAADGKRNFEVGLQLSRLAADRSAQTLIYQSTRRGFASLFPREGRGAGLSPRLDAFGMREDIYSWDVLLHESEDRLARALHDDFQQQRRNEGVLDSQNPGWDQLGEDGKDSNRHAADHIPIKLRAAGYHSGRIESGKTRIERFADNEILLLAQMEHCRWCAERCLAGWSYGPAKHAASKVHPSLVPWSQLLPGEQKKDVEQIEAIPRVLAEIGQAIYRSDGIDCRNSITC